MKKFASVFAIISFFISYSAWAALRIEVTQGVERAIPIAVVPFAVDNNQTLPTNVSQVVHDDLARSGEFNVMDPKSIDMARARDFNYWKERGMDYVVILAMLNPRVCSNIEVNI